MLDKFKDMGKLLKQAKEMKSAMAEIQKQLKKELISAEWFSKKNKGIKVVVNGELEIQDVIIDPDLLTESNKKELEKGLKTVFTDAIKRAKDLATRKLSSASNGLIPGM